MKNHEPPEPESSEESSRQEPPRPSHAESTRTLMSQAGKGVLSTLDHDSGHPYGSIVEVAPGPDGEPLMLLSELASHTKNFRADPRASLCIEDPLTGPRPLALQRATLMGRMVEVEEPGEWRDAYLEAHPSAENYVDFGDFSFWRLDVERVRYIGGFGRMSWFDADVYRAVEPDVLAQSAAGIVEHMNDDHDDALVDYAMGLAGLDNVEAATMVGVDRLGFDMEVQTDEGLERIRIPFEPPIEAPGEVRHRMVELVQEARANASD